MKKLLTAFLAIMLFVPGILANTASYNEAEVLNALSEKIESAAFRYNQSISTPDQYRQILLNRFLRYVQVDSQSVYGPQNSFVLSDEVKNAADLLYAELQQIISQHSAGVKLHMSDWKYIYVELPSNLSKKKSKKVPTLGFSCHYDVTPEAPGHGIHPQVHTNYDGGTIWINQEQNKFLDQNTDPYLAKLIGETIVTSDGTTLLGADDKAGTAILVTTIQTLLENPSIPHGKIQIVFTPNEDVGQSAEKLNSEFEEWLVNMKQAQEKGETFNEPAPPQYYNPDISFDFDGEVDGQIMIENFTAVGYDVEITGHRVHPSSAKALNGLDPIQVASMFVASIPSEWWPQYSEGREHYLHPYTWEELDVKALAEQYPDKYDPEVAVIHIAIRSRFFDAADGKMHEDELHRIAEELMSRFDTRITIKKTLQYENVAYGIHPSALPIAMQAVQDAGATPNPVSVRGGTTTAMFNAMWGITGYTYFTGQQRMHSVREWLSEKDMFQAYKTALNTIEQVMMQFTK